MLRVLAGCPLSAAAARIATPREIISIRRIGTSVVRSSGLFKQRTRNYSLLVATTAAAASQGAALTVTTQVQRLCRTCSESSPRNISISSNNHHPKSFASSSTSSNCSNSSHRCEYESSSSSTTATAAAIMRLSRHVGPTVALLVTTAAVFSFQPAPPVCRAENKFRFFSSSSSSSSSTKKEEPPSSSDAATTTAAAAAKEAVAIDESIAEAKENGKNMKQGQNGDSSTTATNGKEQRKQKGQPCPFYGCPLRPVDVHYNTAAIKEALAEMRSDRRTVVSDSHAAATLSTAATHQHATLTLIGYKGGELLQQINQDRAIIVAPYSIVAAAAAAAAAAQCNADKESNDVSNATTNVDAVQSFLSMDRILLGVFDGHAPLGELVSEYTATELPKLLAQKLAIKAATAAKAAATTATSNSNNAPVVVLSEKDEIELTKAALIETFVELDRTAPADPSGGCTATIVLSQGSKLYVANAGDSRSFIVAYRPSTSSVTVAYMSREDKPSLPDERARVEAAGGQVYIPARGTSRVVYHDSTTGAPTGLAMSRSIGDWEAGRMGVIPNPIVDVLDTNAVIAKILLEDVGDEMDEYAYQVNPVGNIVNVLSEYTTSKSSSSGQRGGGRGGYHAVGGADDDVYLFAVSATDGLMDYLVVNEIARILAHSLFDEAGAHPVTAAEHLIFAAANAWQEAKQGRYRDDIAIAVSALRRPPHHHNNKQGNNDNDKMDERATAATQ